MSVVLKPLTQNLEHRWAVIEDRDSQGPRGWSDSGRCSHAVRPTREPHSARPDSIDRSSSLLARLRSISMRGRLRSLLAPILTHEVLAGVIGATSSPWASSTRCH